MKDSSKTKYELIEELSILKRPDDFIGKKFLYFLPDEATREHVRSQYMSLTPENPVKTYEHKVIVADVTNQCYWHRWTDHAFLNDNGQISHFQSIGQNITEQKRAEKTLQEKEEQYRHFFSTFRDCVFITSVDGHWIDLNAAAVQLFGYDSREELLEIKIPDLYVNTDERKWHIQIIDEYGYVQDMPISLRKKDGTGRVIGYQGIIRDITESKWMEEALYQSEDILRGVFKVTPVGLCIMKDRVFQSVNKAFFENLGYSESDIIGHTPRMLYENE